MNRKELQNLMPPTPDHFVNRMDETLKEIENMNKKHVKRTGATILLAAAIMVMLAGTAVAAANVFECFGLFDFYAGNAGAIVPIEGAQGEIETNLAEVEGEFGRVSVQEASYSGSSYSVVVHFEPSEGIQAFYPDVRLLNAEGEGVGGDDQHFDDGSVSFLDEGFVTGEAPDTLEAEVILQLYRDQEPLEPIVIPIRMTKKGAEIRLIPQGKGERWSVVSATLSGGRFNSTLDIIYRYEPTESESMGVDIQVLLPDGTELASGCGFMQNVEQPDGTVLNRQQSIIQSLEETPDTIILRPKVIDGDWLDAIECRVEIAD